MNAATRTDFLALQDETPIGGNSSVDLPFYLVVCTESIWDPRTRRENLTRGYKFVHPTEVSAETESWRLALEYRGTTFAVVKGLAAVRYCQEKHRLVWDESP